MGDPLATMAVTTPGGPGRDDPPLSVGLVSPGWPPEGFANGVVTSVSTLAGELRRLGHRVSILANQVRGDRDDPEVIEVSRVAPRPAFWSRGLDRLMNRLFHQAWTSRRFCRALGTLTRRLVLDRGLEVLEMEEAFGWPHLLRPEIPIPIVVRLHGPWFLNGPLQGAVDDAGFRARVRAERLGICSADFVTAPSRSVLDLTRTYYDLPLENALVIPNLAPFLPPQERWSRRASDPDLILFVGRFDWHKGGDLIIDAFAEVARRNPGARLCFVGPDRGFNDRSGRRQDLVAYLEDRIPGALGTGRVRWLGQKTPSEIHPLRKLAGVTVCCSRYETFGFSLIEAMAHGSPVVATDVGAIAESIEDGVNGLLCRPDDPIDLADKILRLRADGDLAERLGGRACLDCESRHRPRSLAMRMIDVYRGISIA